MCFGSAATNSAKLKYGGEVSRNIDVVSIIGGMKDHCVYERSYRVESSGVVAIGSERCREACNVSGSLLPPFLRSSDLRFCVFW